MFCLLFRFLQLLWLCKLDEQTNPGISGLLASEAAGTRALDLDVVGPDRQHLTLVKK